MEYENIDKVEELVKQIHTQEVLLEVIKGFPKITIEQQYGAGDILIDLNRSFSEDMNGHGEDFIHALKVTFEQKIFDFKKELKKL